MRKAVLVILCVLLAQPIVARADTPVPPTGTPTPVPSATSKYAGLRNTPTPIVLVTMDMGLHTNDKAAQLADEAISIYEVINRNGVVDFVFFITILAIILGVLFKTIKRAKAGT